MLKFNPPKLVSLVFPFSKCCSQTPYKNIEN